MRHHLFIFSVTNLALFSRTKSRLKWLIDRAKRTRVEQVYRRRMPPICHGAGKVLLVEGMWDNPNHWLRLWIFLHAFLADNQADVVGILRSRNNWDNWNKRKSLEALGIRRFVYLEDGDNREDFYAGQAKTLLSGVVSPRQILELKLPDELPAYTYFDTVIKQQRHPQPPIVGNPAWAEILAELLRVGELYRNLFREEKIIAVVASHAWKNEWASLCWTTLRHKLPFYYMTAHYNSIRIRKMDVEADYTTPNEHLPYERYRALPLAVQRRLIERGKTYLAERFSGGSDFVILRYASNPEQRNQDRAELLKGMGFAPQKPLVVIFAHSWFDFPHTQAMTNFAEPLDWIQFTLEVIRPLTHVNWAFKPHPCDRWYGSIRLAELVHGLPPHISLMAEDSDSLAVQNAAAALVTIQGTVAIEGAAMGKPVLCADKGMYSEWGFTHTAESREDYAEKLRGVLELKCPTAEQSERAMAFAATAVAPPPDEAHGMKLSCDTWFIEGKLYSKVQNLLTHESKATIEEIDKLTRWLTDPSAHSYNAWKTLDHYTKSLEE